MYAYICASVFVCVCACVCSWSYKPTSMPTVAYVSLPLYQFVTYILTISMNLLKSGAYNSVLLPHCHYIMRMSLPQDHSIAIHAWMLTVMNSNAACAHWFHLTHVWTCGTLPALSSYMHIHASTFLCSVHECNIYESPYILSRFIYIFSMGVCM